MTKSKPITTKEELLKALVAEISQSRNIRRDSDITVSEFIASYESETGVRLSQDMAYKELRAHGWGPIRVSSHDYVWRKKEA